MYKNDKISLSQQIRAKTSRKIRAKRTGIKSVWFGLGMMGLIGWSVTVPTLLGVALGFWIEQISTGSYPWILTFLIIGLTVGCANAWHWINKEHADIKKEDTDD